MNTLQHCRYWYHIFVRLSICLFLTSVRCQNTWVFFAEYVYTTWKGSGLVAKKTKGNYSLQFCIIISKMIRKSAVFYKYLALSQKPPIVVYACRVPCSLLNDVVFNDLDWPHSFSDMYHCSIGLGNDFFYDRINTAVEQSVPVCTVKISSSDQPWITLYFKTLDTKRGRAFARGDLVVAWGTTLIEYIKV